MMQKQQELEDILSFLPHRDPFLFVDRIVDVVLPENPQQGLVGGKIVARFFVREDMPILRGHFPGNPILPGVVQVEMMAQASCFGLRDLLHQDQKIEVALVKIEEAKFRRPIRPGMELVIESSCVKERGAMVQYQSCIKFEDQLMSEASIWATYTIV